MGRLNDGEAESEGPTSVVIEKAEQFEVPRRSTRQRVLFHIKWLVSLGLLAFILSTANMAAVWQALVGTNYLLILAAAVLNPVGGTLIALRWQGLLKSQGVHAPLKKLIQSCIAANFFRQFLPSTIGGDALRAYDSWKLGASKTVAVTTLAVDRVFGIVILLLFAMVALLLSPPILPGVPLLSLWITLGAVGLGALVLVIFLPTSGLFKPVDRVVRLLPMVFQGAFDKLAGSLAQFQGQQALMFRSLGYSLLLQVNVVVFYYLIGTALGLPVPFLAYFIIIPIAVLVMMLPISINAIGLREGIFVLLLALFGVGSSEAIAFAWLEYGLILLYGVMGGIVYVLRR